MQVLRIDEMPTYIDHLRAQPRELELLFQELLISVTQFFRDPDAFEALRAVVQSMLAGKGEGDQIRVWVAGCATGEEVYSIAILIKEEADRLGVSPKVQIFGTDIDEAAVTAARAGRYPSSMTGCRPSGPRAGSSRTATATARSSRSAKCASSRSTA